MKQTKIFSNSFYVIIIFLVIDSRSLSYKLESQPALIPTFDRSKTIKTDITLGIEKSNIYSETFELLTTTTPITNSDLFNSNSSISYTDKSILESSTSLSQDSVSESSNNLLELNDNSKIKIQNSEVFKPQIYIDSIVNTDPYKKLLEFDEKSIENIKKPDVRVTIYHHQGISDPISKYGSGKPWNVYGTGYGIHYEHNNDGSYGREKGYQFEKAHGRDFCNNNNNKDNENECQKYENIANTETKKTPIGNHVESLLKHNNLDIQKWYRETKLNSKINKTNILNNKEIIKTPIYQNHLPELNYNSVKSDTLNTIIQSSPRKLQKISSILSSNLNSHKPINFTYQNIPTKLINTALKSEPIMTNEQFRPLHRQRSLLEKSYSPSSYLKPLIQLKSNNNQINALTSSEMSSFSQNNQNNRYNDRSNIMQIPPSNYLKKRYSHIMPYNSNNFRLLSHQKPETYRQYYPHASYNYLDKSVWPNLRSNRYKSSTTSAIPLSSSSSSSSSRKYLSHYTLPDYLSQSTTDNNIFQRKAHSFGWNPYS